MIGKKLLRSIGINMENITNRAIERLTATDVFDRWKEYNEIEQNEKLFKDVQESFIKKLVKEICKKLLEQIRK